MPDKKPWEKYAVQPTDIQKPGMPWERYTPQAANDLTANPKGEGTYKFTDPGGKAVQIPYSNVGQVMGGHHGTYTMDAGDRARFLKDQAAETPGQLDKVEREVHPQNPWGLPTVSGTLTAGAKHAGEFVTGLKDLTAPPPLPTNMEELKHFPMTLATENAPVRFIKGIAQNVHRSAHQANQYADEASDPNDTPLDRTLSGARAFTTMLSTLNPLNPGGTAHINDAFDSGNPDEAVGSGLVDAGMYLLPHAAVPVLKKVAGTMGDAAMGIRQADRAHGATPSNFLLNKTTGLTPDAIAESGRKSMQDLQTQQTQLLTGAPGKVSLLPAQRVAGDFATKAALENHPGTIKDIGKLGEQVHEDYSSGQPFPPDVDPLRAAALNRGLSNAHTSWNPATANDTMNAAAGQMHHVLAESIADEVPEIRPINQELQSGIPVVRRATALGGAADLGQRVLGRIGARTGAMTLGAAGFGTGHPLLGAAGIVVPELIADPVAQMAVARGAHAASRFLPAASPYLTGTNNAMNPAHSGPNPAQYFLPQDKQVVDPDLLRGVRGVTLPTYAGAQQ